MKPTTNYQSWFFDCDGVILDSNQLKTDVFHELALPYGKDAAKQLVKYHLENGGISRFEKLTYFFNIILQKEDGQDDVKEALKQFGLRTKQKLVESTTTPGFNKFVKSITGKSDCYIVSGGLQSELHEVFKEKDLDKYFVKILGSPMSKEQIFNGLIRTGEFKQPSIYIGDSRYDHQVAHQFNLDFIFMSDYTEFHDWRKYFQNYPDTMVVRNFNELC
jgi:phosphoglycolate phosphatase-like HAD superfamily hydrolase